MMVAHCAHQTEVVPVDPWIVRATVPPKRVLFLAIDGLDPQSLAQGNFALLKKRGAIIPKTEAGILFSVPAIDLAVTQTGSFPKTLSYSDHVYVDTKGKLGPRGQIYTMNALTKGQWTRLVNPGTRGLLRSLKDAGGSTHVIAPSSSLAYAWGIPGADSIRFPRNPNPHWPRAQLMKVLADDPNWKAVFALIPAADCDRALGEVLHYLESKQLQGETLLVVIGVKTQTPRYLIGKNQDKTLLPFETEEVAAVVYDSVIRIWLKSPDRLKVAGLATKAEKIPGVVDIYSKERTGKSVHYIRTFRSSDLPEPTRTWAETKHQGLVEAMVTPSSADVIVVLAQGASEFPLLLWSPNLKREASPSDLPVRLVDLNAVASRLMGLAQPQDEEGHATAIDPYLQD